jgi:hypothetical protein
VIREQVERSNQSLERLRWKQTKIVFDFNCLQTHSNKKQTIYRDMGLAVRFGGSKNSASSKIKSHPNKNDYNPIRVEPT